MSDYTRKNEADELKIQLDNCREYISELETKCRDLAKELRKANLTVLYLARAVEHKRHVADEETLKNEFSYRDGMIAGLKYAIRCNGVSDGEANQ